MTEYPGMGFEEITYPHAAGIPLEQRAQDDKILTYFVRMHERYANPEIHFNNFVGFVNKRFRDLSAEVVAYLQDTIFTYAELDEIRFKAQQLAQNAQTIAEIIEEIAEYGEHEYVGETWVANDLDLLQNTLDNWKYFQGELVSAEVLLEDY